MSESLGSPGTQYTEWFGEVAADGSDHEGRMSLDEWLGVVDPRLADRFTVVGADIEAMDPDFMFGEGTHPIALTLYLVAREDLPDGVGLPGLEVGMDGTVPVTRLEIPFEDLDETPLEVLLVKSFKRMKLRLSSSSMPVPVGKLKVVDEIAIEND
jgi:hypothetical protein